MINKEQVNWIKEQIESHDAIYLFHHVNPDGDCIATSFGLANAIRENYPNKKVMVVATKEDYEGSFKQLDNFIDWEYTITKPEDENYFMIIGDTSVGRRVRHLENFPNDKTVFCFDHHRNELDVKATMFWHEPEYHAAAIMAKEICDALELRISQKTAILLLHGIITDTGAYKFSGSDPLPLKTASELVPIIDDKVIKKFYSDMGRKSKEQINFETWIHNNYLQDGDIVYSIIPKDKQIEFNLTSDQCAQVNLLSIIEGIEYWLFFIEYKDFIRVEFRSNSKPVNTIAMNFGGGGHLNASGCHLNNFDEVKDVIEFIKEQN